MLLQWLHYLLTKLLRAKRLRAPAASRKSTSAAMFSEIECYRCLVDVEATLAAAVARFKAQLIAKKSGRKTQAVAKAHPPSVGPKSASEVLKVGMENGWIS